MPDKIEFGPYLNVKNAIFPVFSADGQRLYYLSDITGTFQLWSVSVEGGWPDQLTFFDERLADLVPAPDGNGLVITRDAGGNEKDQIYVLRGDAAHGVEITALAENPEVKHNFGHWSPDGKSIAFSSNARNLAHFDVYTLEIGTEKSPKLVYQADETLFVVDWSHSGRYLLVLRANTNLDEDLFLIDLQSPGSTPRHLTPHQGSVRYESAIFAADDLGIYLASDADSDFVKLAYLDLDTLELKVLVAPDWDVELLKLSPDGQQLAYTVNEEGFNRLIIRDVAGGSEKSVELPHGTIARLSWSRSSERLAFDFCSPVHNFDAWVYDTRSERAWQVTHSPRGGLNPESFIMPELVHYPTFDGLQIPALWYLPENAKADSRLPVILYVHGGPESQTRFNWSSIFQYFVQRGYAVLAPNVRGSAGYGKHYLSLDDIRKRPDSVTDLKYAVEWLRGNGYADPKKIAVYGGSYGGFMVLSAVTMFPELWAAGVDIVGIANMLTFLEHTSSYRRKLRTAEYGDPDTDRDFLIEISPIHKADRIVAPLMVIHGAQDPRVPVGEAEQIVENLLKRNHPVEYQRFEDEGHGIIKLKNRLVCYPQIANFLDRYLG